MHFLNELYEAFDNLVDDYGMYKLDIVGDCYIVVAGLIKEDQDGFVCVDELDDEQVCVDGGWESVGVGDALNICRRIWLF